MKSAAVLAVCALAVAVPILIPGCATESESVVVYVSVDQVYSEPVLKAFEKSSGIRVRALYDVEAAKTTGLSTRLIAEKENPRADVFWNGEFSQTLRLKELGLLEPLRTSKASGLPAAFVDRDHCWFGLGGRARVFLVNRNLLKSEDYPKSLEDFLNPKYPPDRIGIALPLFGTSATHAAALYAFQGAQPAWRFFSALKSRGIQIVDGNSVVRDRVAGGQWIFGLTDTDDAQGALERGAPVDIVAPDQEGMGTLVVPGTIAAVRGAPHPKEAAILIDYLLRPEIERELIKSGFCQWSLRGDIASSPLFRSGLKTMPVDLLKVQQQFPLAMRQMREIFSR